MRRAIGSNAIRPDRHRTPSCNSFEGPTLSFIKEFLAFLRVRKKYWLIPILLVLVILGGLILLAQGSAVAPFLYPLF
jgi:hypothetical protein